MSTLTKNCHSCYEAVPELANKCKHCFEDLRAKPKEGFKFPLMTPLAFLAITFTGYIWADYISTSQAFNKMSSITKPSIVQISKTGDGINVSPIGGHLGPNMIGGTYAKYEIVAISRSNEQSSFKVLPIRKKRHRAAFRVH